MSKLKAQVVGIFTLMAVVIACMGLMAYVPVHADPVQDWAWLQDQLDNASTDGNAPTVITLTNDIEASEDDGPLTIPEGKYVVLDLNGHTIDRGLYNSTMTDSEIAASKKEDGSVITVYGTFTLKDSSDDEDTPEYDGDGIITGGNTSNSGGGVYVGEEKYFTMYGGSICGNIASECGGGVYIDEWSSFDMYGGTISGNTASKNGGGVYYVGAGAVGSFWLVGGTISDNAALKSGGGVYLGECEPRLYINEGGTISGNTASESGGGVFVASGTCLDMEGGTISGNTASGSGGGVFVDQEGYFYLSGNVQITNNMNVSEVDEILQNVYLNSSIIYVYGGFSDEAEIGVTVSDNARFAKGDDYTLTYEDVSHFTCDTDADSIAVLDNSGKGCFSTPTSWIWLQNQFNTASEDSTSPTVIKLENDFYASEYDEALIIPSSKCIILDLNGHTIDRMLYTLGMADAEISANKKDNGSVIIVNGFLTLSDDSGLGMIKGGNTSSSGGGIYLGEHAEFFMLGGNISENIASESGGGVYIDQDSYFNMYGGTISDNIALKSGGGVCIGDIEDLDCEGASFNMYGGTIIENRASEFGGGVYAGSDNGGKFYLSGNIQITDNIKLSEDGEILQNVYLGSNFLFVCGTLTDEAEIGVTVFNEGADDGIPVSDKEIQFAEQDENYSLTIDDVAHFICDTGENKIAVIAEFPDGEDKYVSRACFVEKNSWIWLQYLLSDSSTDVTAPTVITLEADILALEDDVALDVPEKKYVIIDLNGHTIDFGLYDSGFTAEEIENKKVDDGSVFIVSGSLTIMDSSDDGAGMITGGNTFSSGGGIYVCQNATFTMDGGTICGNVASEWGGGVYVEEGGLLYLAGNVKITNNLQSGEEGLILQNVCFDSDVIYVYDAFADEAEIGVTLFDDVAFAKGDDYTLTSKDVTHLICDDDENKIAALDDEGKAIFVDKLTWDGLQARLDDASGDAEAPTEIRLVNDITALGNQPLTIPEGKYVILDLNGHTLDRGLYNSGMTDEEILAKSDDDGCVIKVLGNLTLTDSSDKETGKITGGNGINIGGGVWVKGSFTMKKGTISGNRSTDVGGGVYVNVSGSFTMKKGTISGNCATDGGGVYINANGTFIMEGGTISENKAEADGAGVYVNGTFTMEGGAISQNSAKQEGGGVYVCMDGTFTMEGGTIGENKAENEGTEVYGSNGSTFAVLGSAKINGNNSDDSTPNISLQTVYQNIVVGGPLTGDAEISFTGYRRYVNAIFAKGSDDYTLTSDDISHFTCEDERLNAALDDNGCLIFLSDWGILQQKFDNADGDSTAPTVIKLDKDIVALATDGALTVPTGKYVTLDLNGHTLDRGLYKSNMTAEEIIAKQDEDGSVIKVLGTLTLIDSSDDVSTSEYDGTGKITGGNQSTSGGGIDIKKNATFTMKGGTISGNYAKSAGGGVNAYGSLELSGNFAITENKIQSGDGLINNDIYTYSHIRIAGQLTCTNQMTVDFRNIDVYIVGDGYELTSEDLEKFKFRDETYILIFDETEKKGIVHYDLTKAEIGDISDQTYSGNEIKPEMTVIFYGKNLCNYIDANYNYEYFDLSYADNIAVGTATITITGKNGFWGTIEKTFKIYPKPVTVSLEASDKQYDGSTNATLKGTPVINGVVSGDNVGVGGGTATFFDKNVGTGKSVVFSGYSLTGVDAGNYSLTSQPANVTANITKADATVKALSVAKSLGEADPTLEATVTGVASGETINYTLARAEGENVGEYDITVTLGENQNYNVTVENAKFTISEVIAKVITAPTANTFAYDGKEHELVTAGVADTAMEYSLDGNSFTSEIPKKKDAGTYRVYFRAAADGNHTVGTIGNVEASINRIDATVTAINTGKDVNETDPLLTANVTGLIGTDTVSYTVTRASGEEIGSYTITVTGDAVQGNYNVTYVNGTFTIAINKITPSVTLGYETTVYDGTEKKPDVTVTNDGAELSTDDYVVSYSNNTNAGTATVTVSAKEGSDYTFEAVSVDFAITKASAPANVPATVMNVTSDCEKLSDVALITDWSWENGETALVEGQAVSAKAVYSGSDASNFETVSVTIEVTRAKKEHVHTIGTEKLDEKAPSCTEKGSYVLRKYCTDCGETISTETITVDETGHTFVDGVCSSCGAKENPDNNEQGNGSGNEQNNDSGNEQGSDSDTQQTNNNSTQQSNNQQQGSGSSSQQTNNNSTQQNNNQQQGSDSDTQQTNNNSNTQQSNNQQQGSGSGSQQGSDTDNKPSGSKDPAPVVTQNADGTATKTETKETKDGTKETVATTTDANGKIIQIVTERVSTDEKGNETKKVTTVNPDGTSNSEQTLTNASGKVIETVKESVKTDVQGTQTDKSVTEKISGTIIESTMITFPSGSSKTNTVEKQKDGTVTTTDISQKKNGSYTSEQTVNNVDGSSVTENAKVNAKGNLTSYSKETVASSGAKTTTHYYVKQQVKVSGSVIKAGKMHLGKVITNATQYKVSKYATVNGKKYYITAITAKSFKNCKNLKKITLGKKITSIEHGAFANLSEDAKIVIKVEKKGTFLRIKRLVIAAGFTNEANIIWSKK